MAAISAANLTRLRTTIHGARFGFVAYAPPAIWTAQVNGAQTTGARAITVDNVAQVRAPAKHFIIWFGTTAGGNDLGEARFISYGAPTLNVSAHNIPLANDTYITVLEDIRLDAIHVAISATDVVSEDGNEAYGSNFNTQYIPLARCGCDAFGFIDPDTGLATINFKSDSVAVANGATISSHLWVWRSGTVTAGSTVSAGTVGSPNTVTWDTAGDYLCSYTVTDSNGKTHTRYFVVYIRNKYTGTLPYANLEVSSIEGDVEQGTWRTTIKVYTSATQANFPTGARCAIIADDWYGSENVNIGHETFRENMVFVGRIVKAVTRRRASSSSYVEMELESISGAMERLWQLAGGLTSNAAPTDWHQLSGLTHNLAAHHVLTRHCTVSQATDCYINLNSYTAPTIDLTDTNVLDQLKQISAPTRGRVGCSAEGTLYLEADPQLLPVASRSAVYTIATTFADFRDEVDFGDETMGDQVDQVDFAGVSATDTPIFSLAPQYPRSRANRVEKVDQIRAADQAEANILAGIFVGKINNQF